MTEQRNRDIDFLYPHTLTQLTFITNFAEEEVVQRGRLMVVDWSVHLAYLFSSFLISCLLKLSAKFYKNDNKSGFHWWTLIAIAFRQTYDLRIARSVFNRILLSVWELATLILAIFIGALSFDTMATNKQIKTIDTLLELVQAQQSGSIDVYIYEMSADYSELMVLFRLEG